MAGHSHWAGIKHKKAANDAKRGKVWSKIARVIIMAAKGGGGDPAQNLALRYAIEKAKGANMPKDTIEKSIKKGTGDLGDISYDEVLYEGYGCNGVAVMAEDSTDNRNRTASEMRKIFDIKGGSLGASGCVAWMFAKKGLITVNAEAADEETVMEIALEAGAEDFAKEGGLYEITCEPEVFDDVKAALVAKELPIEEAEISQIPSSTVELDASGAKKMLGLMESLEDHDDVQNAYANFDISEEVLKELEG